MSSWPMVFRPNLPYEIKIPRLSLFDSRSRQKRLVPDDQPFTIYVCGVTPYDATHIGHAATYLAFDLVHRYQLASGTVVRFLENVTDIDDPLFERARRDGVDWRVLASGQLRLFLSDMTNLRVLPPFDLVTVTEAMPRITQFVSDLKDSGATYRLGSETYLDLSRFTDFSDLHRSVEDAIALFRDRGGDPDRIGKRHPLDPLLWRASLEDEPRWQSSCGEGRPGWHVECNAISSMLLDGLNTRTISLQGGGADLEFPHHYMTAVQSFAKDGASFAHLTVHAGMVRYRGEKMSKSLGNLVFVSDLIASGVDPMAIRLALMMGHYRTERDWSDALLGDGIRLRDRLVKVLSMERVPDYATLMDEIMASLSDDLDTPKVITEIERYLRFAQEQTDSLNGRSPGALSRFFDSVLGLAL